MSLQDWLYAIFVSLFVGGWFAYWMTTLLDGGSVDLEIARANEFERLLKNGSRLVLSVGVGGDFPYRLGVNGRVFAFRSLESVAGWFVHLDDYLNWAFNESEREQYSPIALGFAVSAAHPAVG